jgi:hypothetical protein
VSENENEELVCLLYWLKVPSMGYLIFLKSLSAWFENRFNKKNDVLFPYHLFMKDSVREFFMKICCPYEFRFLLTLLCIFYKHPYAFCALPDIEGRSLAVALIAADEYLWMCQKDCLCTLPH